MHIEKMLSFNEGDMFKVFKMLSDTMCCDTSVQKASSPKTSPSLRNEIENIATRTILSPEHVRLLLYAFLPRLKKENQMQLLESCGKMLENRWFNAAQCSSIGMIREIIRLLLEASFGGDSASLLSGIRPRRESMTDLDRFELWLNMICRIGT